MQKSFRKSQSVLPMRMIPGVVRAGDKGMMLQPSIHRAITNSKLYFFKIKKLNLIREFCNLKIKRMTQSNPEIA